MKRVIGVLAILMVIPVAALAMSPISEETMESVTAQSGVDLTFTTDTSIDVKFPGIAWGDTDGNGHLRIDGSGDITIGILIGQDEEGPVVVHNGGTITVDVTAANGIEFGLGTSNLGVTVSMPTSLTIGLGSGKAPALDGGGPAWVDTASGAIVGDLAFEGITVDVIAPTSLYINAH